MDAATHPVDGGVLAQQTPPKAPQTQAEQYGFNIDESLATSYVGKYTLYHTIGEGAFGKVKVAVCKPTGEVFAIKIMDKRQILKQDFTSQVRREIYIMRSLKHKHIVRMHEVLSSESKLYIVMDYVRGGELFHHLEKNGRVDESHARQYFQQLVDGVDFCHRSGVAHRDLKPENILLDENGDIRITDFGFSSMRGVDVNADLLHTQCGTPDYCAPEIIECSSKGYSGAKVDAWSCGIILFALLAGRLPFVEQDTEKLYDLILACQVHYPKWISPHARDLLQHLLVRDPARRFDLQGVKHHPWFLQDYEGDDARMLKKRPFFNKNNQKNLASAPTTPAVPETSNAPNGIPMGGGVTLPTEASISNKADVGLAVKDPSPERLPADPERQFFTKSVHMSDIKTPTTPSMSASANGHTNSNIIGNTTLSSIPTVVPAAREPSPSPQKGPEPFKPFPGKTLADEPEANGISDHYNHQDHEFDDNASDGGDSVEDYTEKPVPELTLPIEPLSLNRSRPAQSERPRSHAVYPPLSVSRSQQPIRIQKNNEQPMAQRHRSDVTDNSIGRQYMHAAESVSLSSLPGPRRAVPPNIGNVNTGNTTTSARDHRHFRHVRGTDTTPGSPLLASMSNGCPGLVSRPLSINGTPDYGPGSYGKTGGSSRLAPYSTPSSSKANLSNGNMLQTEVTARHIWSIVNKWRGQSDPVSPSSSMDILSDFRVLTSEVGNLRADEKGVVLDRFLALFEAFGLADMQNRSSVMSAIQHQHQRQRGQIENDMDDDSTYDEVGNTAGDSRQHSVQSGQRRPPTDISSEEETLSWSPVHADSQNRQQSDLARRREMSDLLNRWILKTGATAGSTSSGPTLSATRSASTPVQGLDDDPIPSSLDIQELHRLMKQHHGGREESNLADELYKLVHAEHGAGDGEGSVFSHGASPSSMRSADASTLSQSLNRWHMGSHAGLQKNRSLRPPSSSHGRLRSDYSHSHTRYGDSQGTLPSVHNDAQSSASVGNSSDNNSYAAMLRDNMIGNGVNRSRQHPANANGNPNGTANGNMINMSNMTPNMATSMNLQDVEYYGPERKNGMAMKIRGALLTMKVRNQKLAENLTQFTSNLPAQDIIRIMVAILQNVGGIVTLKKETKRKLKCRIHRHDDYYLCAAIDFQTDNAGSTTVVFKRSKEDRGRTDIASFHEFYEKVRELFLKEVHHRYDRNGNSNGNGNRNGGSSANGAPKRRRSPRYIGGSFG